VDRIFVTLYKDNESAENIAEYRIKIISKKFRAHSGNVISLLLSRNLMIKEKQN
jgi:hypothetical protein